MTFSVHRLNTNLFKLFLFLIFFVYYQTIWPPGTLHTWVMFFGCFITIPMMFKKYGKSSYISLPLDYVLTLFMFALIFLGYMFHSDTADWFNTQAYSLMLVTYVYVRENFSRALLPYLARLMSVYLVINGLLVIVQTATGQYFPARYFAAGEPSFSIAVGVADGATKNGMLIAVALATVWARLLFKHIKFGVVDFIVFVIGFISLALSPSRAGLIAFGAAAGLGSLFAIIQSMRSKTYSLSMISITGFSTVILLFVGVVSYYGLTFQSLYDLRGNADNLYGLNVLVYKWTVFSDDSTSTRFHTLMFALKLALESPLSIATIGFGPGTFEKLFGLNLHNSMAELFFTLGLFGLLSFFCLMFIVLRRCFSRENALEIMPILFGFVAIFVFMLAHDVLRGRIFWVMFGMASAIAYTSPARVKGRAKQ